METTSVQSDMPREAKRSSQSTVPDDAFDTLLAAVQSGVFATAAALPTEASGLDLKPAQDGESARHSRIREETDAARQAEVDAHATRRADPSSVRDGAVSARHERMLAGKEAAGRASKTVPTAETQTQTATRSVETPNPQGPQDTSRQDTNRDLSLAAESTKESTGGRATPAQVANQNTGDAKAPSPSPSTEPSNAVAVPTAGAARAAESHNGPTGKSAAETIGRLLGARGGQEAPKAASPAVLDPAPAADRSAKGRAESTGGKQAKAETPSAESPEKVRRAGFESIVRNLRLQTGAKSSSATIRLDPPELGKMKVDVRMVGETLEVRVEAASPHAREMLSARAEELTAALRAHDLDIDRIEIVAPNEAPVEDDAGLDGQLPQNAESFQEPGSSAPAGGMADAEGEEVITDDSGAAAEAGPERIEGAPEARLDMRV